MKGKTDRGEENAERCVDAPVIGGRAPVSGAALKSCSVKNAAIGLAAAWLLVWLLVMALIFFALAASVLAAAHAAKCRRSPAAGTNAIRLMTRPRAATWGSGHVRCAADRHPRRLQVPPQWERLPPYLASPAATEPAGPQHGLSFTAPGRAASPRQPGPRRNPVSPIGTTPPHHVQGRDRLPATPAGHRLTVRHAADRTCRHADGAYRSSLLARRPGGARNDVSTRLTSWCKHARVCGFGLDGRHTYQAGGTSLEDPIHRLSCRRLRRRRRGRP